MNAAILPAVRAACDLLGSGDVAPSDVMTQTRGRGRAALVRQVAMWAHHHSSDPILDRLPSLSATGRAFDRDRTTVRHAIKKVEGMRSDSPGFRDRTDRVCAAARGR